MKRDGRTLGHATLEEMRMHDELADMVTLKRGNRLSITPVTAAEWKFILKRLGE